MKSRKRVRRVEPARRGELEIAAAVAREAILQLHVGAALRLIDLAADRVHPTRMMRIYVRLHGFGQTEAMVVSSRLLAQLGKRAARGEVTPLSEADADLNEEQVSIVRAVRDRLRGRQHHDLRRWIELHTGSTKVALLELHVRHAEVFSRQLADKFTIEEAVDVYMDMAGAEPTLRDVLYFGVLDRLANEELPRREGVSSWKARTPQGDAHDATTWRDRARLRG